jgi:hypothetical protein
MDMGTLFDGLQGDFTTLATTAGIADPDGLFNRAVNNAYLLMGLDPTASPTPGLSTQQALDAPWLAEYYALRSLVRALAGLVDIRSPNQQKHWSQAYKQAKELFADATAAVQSRGYALDVGFSLVRFNEDWMEPFYGIPTSGSIVG